MKLSSQEENEVIQRFFDLYITAQYKYIIMDQNGKYLSYDMYKNNKHKILGKWHIKDHLKGKYTIGIYAAEWVTSFICFDIDIVDPINAKWATYKLIDTLISIGVPEEYIYISTSGNKGYHVDIYFDNALYNSVVKDFYNIVMSKMDMSNIKGEIELRPTRQGLKLPLGRNFKNKNKSTNKCWYVDYENSLKPIKDIKYILTIKQINSDIIKNVIEQERNISVFDHIAEKEEAIKIENTKGYLDSKYTKLSTYDINIDNEATIENALKIESKGITIPGTRHNYLYELCKYYKYLNMTPEENENNLKVWMNEQDTRMYNTSILECYEDIKGIVKYIYDNDINLIRPNKEIKITYDDMQDILKADSKNEKLLLYSMIIHSKRYSNDKGIFYMTYNQMVLTSGLSERTVKRLVNILEENKHIEIVERNRKILDGKGRLITKRPNKYKVLLSGDNIEDNPLKYITIDNTVSINLDNALLFLVDKSILKEVLPDRHYRQLPKESILNI